MGTLNRCITIFCLFCISFVFIPFYQARAADTLAQMPGPEGGIFTKNRITFEVLQGFFTDSGIGPSTPDFDYAQTSLRLGWMLTHPKKVRFLPEGNWEFMFELCRSSVTKGPGDYMAGATALLRYNIVAPERKLIPYIQAGSGIVFNDVYKDRSQEAIGQDLEFTPQIGLGFQYMLNGHWSIIVEGKYHHISNAGLDNRNDGMNSLGGSIGCAYFFW
jgi:hypothetical protein